MKTILILLLALLISCGRGELSKDFIQSLSKSTGQNYRVVKYNGNYPNEDYIVIQNQSTNEFYAINIKDFEKSNQSASDYFYQNLSTNKVVSIVRVDSRQQIVYQSYYVDGHIQYYPVLTTFVDYYGDNGMIFDLNEAMEKDLEKIGASIENVNIQKLSKSLVNQYGFSMQRAREISFLKLNYDRMSKLRRISQNDKEVFFRKLTGLELTSAQKALEDSFSGNRQNLEKILRDSSEFNKVSPEALRSLIGDMFLY